MSRSGATGAALAEAQKINTSLLALGNVIAALTERKAKASHVPFRDSILTRLLQQSLGGNCKTCLIICASPADADVTETLSTLRFASRAKFVRNDARVNAVIDASALHAHALAEVLQRHLDDERGRLVAARAQCKRVAARAIHLAMTLTLQRKHMDGRLSSLQGDHEVVDAARHDALARARASQQRFDAADAERMAMASELLEEQQAHAQTASALQQELANARAESRQVVEASTGAAEARALAAEARAVAAEARAATTEQVQLRQAQVVAVLEGQVAALRAELAEATHVADTQLEMRVKSTVPTRAGP